ncbi:hypothetical protein F959_01263 [Acinetobacter venetianus RAG-1 = CIP 110063]|uniref:Uncharacterized protein n=1 Tax=Acinetobacter venetianus (strain ATCC 31012 / DSM 23050 / BCRC 14357 / CCUG 45561 / CIP 110063 / KCTC 2702 / LMG 19082 / RAG-1) TaxID=1191460 RepID=N9A116_ACIVR|nr:hypothetical protein [Acinetobacter venetianus]ENV37743.1 hypothetical protein F959_01263 [Acinetobacter venetianus RAG-1 = CIP 110063]
MTIVSFEEIHSKFCEKIDTLQSYNNYTCSIELKRIAIKNCLEFIKLIKKEKYSAIKNKKTYIADQLFHMQCVLNSLLSSLKIWLYIEKKQFKNGWDSLIDAYEYLFIAKKINEYKGLSNLEMHLNSIEKSIFPKRKIYLSAAFTSSIGSCSICNKSFYECNHIENNIYCGKLCYRKNISNIKGNHIALVENPRDRRCLITNYGHKNSIIDSFTLEEIEQKNENQEGLFHAHILSFSKLDWD